MLVLKQRSRSAVEWIVNEVESVHYYSFVILEFYFLEFFIVIATEIAIAIATEIVIATETAIAIAIATEIETATKPQNPISSAYTTRFFPFRYASFGSRKASVFICIGG